MITLNEINCIADISRYQARINRQRLAHIFEGREPNYPSFDSMASQVASGLIAAKCKPNTRVGFIGKNSDYFFEVLIGASKANVVTTPVNWRLAPPEIEYILNHAEVEVLFVGAEFFETVQNIVKKISSIHKIIAIEGGHKDWENYTHWRDSQDNTDPMLPICLDDDVVQMYTSGTTGHPKGLQLTNGNYLDAANQGALGGAGDWQEGENCMVAIPVFNVAGLNTALTGLLQGVANIIIKDVDPVVIPDSLERYRVKYTLFVPAVILFLNSILGIRDRDLSNLDIMMYGDSPIYEDILLTAKEIFNCDFYQIYGLTETSGQGVILGPENHDPARGKPAPTSESRIIGEDGLDTSANVVGKILYRSGSLMKGYWKNQAATAKSIQDSWFYTGDSGYLDDEGYLFIYDRIKDMIVTGGENVYPAEVENSLFSHEAIADVAVTGVLSKKWGESVKAIVVLKPGKTASEEDIITYTKSKIASYKVPKSIDFVKVLPRNPSGKLHKRELRAQYWKDQQRQVG